MRGRERGALLAQIMAAGGEGEGRWRGRERGAASSLPGGDLLGGYRVAAPAAAGTGAGGRRDGAKVLPLGF